jgi:hypothetical protein
MILAFSCEASAGLANVTLTAENVGLGRYGGVCWPARRPAPSPDATALSYAPSAAGVRAWGSFSACYVAEGRPLSGLEAQKLAQAVLTECGYTWSGYAVKDESPAVTDRPLQPKTRATLTKRSA